MRTCSDIRPLLPLSAGNDLDPVDETAVRSHLAACAECTDEIAKFLQVISDGRALLLPADNLSEAVIRRVSREAVERRGRGWAVWPLPFLPIRPGLLASAVAVLLALVALPVVLRQLPRAPGERPMKIDVVVQEGAVLLAWSDGFKSSYTVYKSGDPRAVAGGEAHVVKGNVWADTEPGTSPIVYYRIE